jgi:putative oxidoreductase
MKMLRPLATTLARLEEPAYAALRIVVGLLFMQHGIDKLFGGISGMPQPEVASQMWIGGIIELGGGALVTLGLFTRVAAFLSSGQMAVAYFQFHWPTKDPHLAHLAWHPMVNHGEAAVLYCFVFLFIAMRGAGPYSIDARLSRA